MGYGFCMARKDTELKGGEEMEVQITKRAKHLQKCPYCDEKPAGFGINALLFNFEIHLQKHFRRGEITQIEMDSAMKRLKQAIDNQNANE